MELDTKYPIFMVHGTGFRDRKLFNYWGRIPKALANGGARVCYGGQDAWREVEGNAETIAQNLDKALQESGAEKVNIIAHSKGGVEARYMISTLGYANKVATLTTISTPHHGSPTMDWLMGFPTFLIKFVGFFVNIWFRILGDKKPNFYLTCINLTTSYMDEFNKNNPNSENILYQSYAGAMKHSRSDMLLWLPHVFVKRKGESDGLVLVDSAKWGEFRGVIRGQGARGVSHADEVDMRRRNFKRKPKNTQEGHYNDIREVYINIVKDLKERGF